MPIECLCKAFANGSQNKPRNNIQSVKIATWGVQALAMMPEAGSREGHVRSSPKAQNYSGNVSLNCISLSRAFALCCRRYLPVPKCSSPCARGSPLFHLCPAYICFSFSRNRLGQGHGSASLPFPQLLWADLTSCWEIPLVHCFFCVCPQGGGHDLHISQPALKISIKTTIIEGSSHGTEREDGKQEEIFVCQRQQQEKVLVVKNILSVVCHLSYCFPHHRAAVQISLAQKFNEEAGACCRTTWCLIVDAGKSAVQTLESPHLQLLLVGLELEGLE